MADSAHLEALCPQVRRDILRMVHAVNSGHPGGSMGCTEFFVALYFEALKHTPVPFDMDGTNQDVFYLSNGHISPVFYSILARSGYFDLSELATFRKLNSRLQGHPTTHEGLPGVRMASGSLGQGLSVALGTALAKKSNGDSHLVYTLHGDGELQEGQIWEAVLYAGAKGVDVSADLRTQSTQLTQLVQELQTLVGGKSSSAKRSSKIKSPLKPKKTQLASSRRVTESKTQSSKPANRALTNKDSKSTAHRDAIPLEDEFQDF